MSETDAKYHKMLDNVTTQIFLYSGEFTISYYDACMDCCGKTDGITASGVKAQEGITVAADTTKLPIGTKIFIEGIGYRIVQDKGSAVKGNKLDIYVNNHNSFLPYISQKLKVWVVTE